MIDFPASPTDGQIFSATNGVVYKYSAAYSSWLAQNPAPPLGGTGQFTANNTVAQSPAANTPSGVNFSTVIAGNAGLWYSTSTMRYTPPAGSYFISVTGHAGAPTGSNGTALLALYKNGAQIGQGVSGSGSPSFSIPLSLGEYVDANGTDYFNAVVTCQAAGMNFTGDIFTAFPLTGMQGPTGGAPGPVVGDFCALQTSAFPTLTTSYATLILTQVLTGNSGAYYNTTTGRYTPPAGRYAISAGLCASAAGLSALGITLRKNGTVVIQDESSAGGASYRADPQVSLIVDANGSDWFDIQGYSSGGAVSLAYYMTFHVLPNAGHGRAARSDGTSRGHADSVLRDRCSCDWYDADPIRRHHSADH